MRGAPPGQWGWPLGVADPREPERDAAVLLVADRGIATSGIDYRRWLRNGRLPIIMLTARGQERDRLMGLELGADDYIVKPFSFRELLARVRAVQRRQALERGEASAATDELDMCAIKLDRLARLVWLAGQPVDLTPREFDLLALLMERRGQAVRRRVLLDRVWGEGCFGDTRALDVQIHWLREKLEDDPSHPRYIQTVRGYGYRLVEPDAPATPV